jgi:hypothetical protein
MHTMNARLILATVAGATLLVSPFAASAASTKDAKTTSAPAKPAKVAKARTHKTHKAAKPKTDTKAQ